MSIDEINAEAEKYLRRNQNTLLKVEHWKRRIEQIASARTSEQQQPTNQQKAK